MVVSDIPGNREVVKENQNGYLADVSDHKVFAQKILYLIENPGDRQRLGGFADDFSAWDADFMVKAEEKLYCSLTGIETKI